MLEPITPHEKECALAALAALIERTRGKQRSALRRQYKEVDAAPLLIGNAIVHRLSWSEPWD